MGTDGSPGAEIAFCASQIVLRIRPDFSPRKVVLKRSQESGARGSGYGMRNSGRGIRDTGLGTIKNYELRIKNEELCVEVFVIVLNS